MKRSELRFDIPILPNPPPQPVSQSLGQPASQPVGAFDGDDDDIRFPLLAV